MFVFYILLFILNFLSNEFANATVNLHALACVRTEEIETYNSLIDVFNNYAKNNNLDINLSLFIYNSMTDHCSIIENLLARKSTKYDLYFYNYVDSAISAKNFVDLRQHLTDDNINVFNSDILSKSCVYDDKLIGLPVFLSYSVLYSNEELLKKYNREIPNTWEELIETAIFIVSKEFQLGNTIVGYNGLFPDNENGSKSLYEFIYSYRNGFSSEFPEWTSENAINALKKLKEIKEYISSDQVFRYGTNDVPILFSKFLNTEVAPGYKKTALPGCSSGISASTMSGAFLGIPNCLDKNKINDALMVLKYFTSKEIQKQFIKENQIYYSAITSLYDDQEVCQSIDCDLLKSIQPVFFPITKNYHDFESTFRSSIYNYLFSNGNDENAPTAEEVLNAVDDFLNPDNELEKNLPSIEGIALPYCTNLIGKIFKYSHCSQTSDPVYTYCLSARNKIYEITSADSFACNSEPLGPGVRIFKVPENSEAAGVQEIRINSELKSDTVSPDASRLVIYVCDEDSICHRSMGYVKIDYKNGSTSKHNYLKIGTNGGSAANAGVTCDGTASTIGLFSSEKGICLSPVNKMVPFAESGDYLLDGAIAAASIFPASSKKKGYLISTSSNIIYYNTIYTKTDQCVDASTKKVERRTAQICGDNNCENYYTCTNGNCKDTTFMSLTCDLDTASGCDEGYYLTTTDTTSIVEEAGSTVGDLYKCEESGGGFECTLQTGEAIPLGYLIHKSAINADVPIIQCSLSADGTKRECIGVKPTATSCTTSTAGKPFLDPSDNSYKICLDGSHVAEKESSAVSYLMNATGVLGLSDNSVLVTVDTIGNIILELKGTHTKTLMYVFVNDNKKIILKEENNSYCPEGTGLTEYKLNDMESVIKYYVKSEDK